MNVMDSLKVFRNSLSYKYKSLPTGKRRYRARNINEVFIKLLKVMI